MWNPQSKKKSPHSLSWFTCFLFSPCHQHPHLFEAPGKQLPLIEQALLTLSPFRLFIGSSESHSSEFKNAVSVSWSLLHLVARKVCFRAVLVFLFFATNVVFSSVLVFSPGSSHSSFSAFIWRMRGFSNRANRNSYYITSRRYPTEYVPASVVPHWAQSPFRNSCTSRCVRVWIVDKQSVCSNPLWLVSWLSGSMASVGYSAFFWDPSSSTKKVFQKPTVPRLS